MIITWAPQNNEESLGFCPLAWSYATKGEFVQTVETGTHASSAKRASIGRNPIDVSYNQIGCAHSGV